jgi:hypothetical protein
MSRFSFHPETGKKPLKCREMRKNAPKFAGVVAGVILSKSKDTGDSRGRNRGTPANPQLPG